MAIYKKINLILVCLGLILLLGIIFHENSAWAFFKRIEPTEVRPIQKPGKSEHLSLNPRPSDMINKNKKAISALINSQRVKGPVLQAGICKEFKKASSKGNDLPLKFAMQLLMPTAMWKFETIPDKSNKILDTIVSWKTDENWLDAVTQIGRQTGFYFVVDWNLNKVLAGHPDQMTTLKTPSKNDYLKKVSPHIETVQRTITGDIKKGLTNFVKKNGYLLKIIAPEEKKFELEFPIFLAGKSFKEDLYTINSALNQNSVYSFDFHVFQGNRIVMLDIKVR